jgi:toxin-antitoxin system PIN domain toxin
VILLDVNLLLYASIESFREHRAAKDWLDRQLNGASRVGLPWPSISGYLRIATNARLFAPQISTATAWNRVQAWLASPLVWLPVPTDRHAEILGDLLALPGVSGNLVPDAHLATLAIEHGLTLCSADGDFARFPQLRWLNPLSSKAEESRQ